VLRVLHALAVDGRQAGWRNSCVCGAAHSLDTNAATSAHARGLNASGCSVSVGTGATQLAALCCAGVVRARPCNRATLGCAVDSSGHSFIKVTVSQAALGRRHSAAKQQQRTPKQLADRSVPTNSLLRPPPPLSCHERWPAASALPPVASECWSCPPSTAAANMLP
jgi:hypothetical protein